MNIDKPVVLGSNPLFRTGATFAFVALAILVDSRLRGEWQVIPKSQSLFWQVFAAGILLGIADALYGAGFYFGIVPYVAALKRVQALWTVICGSLFLKEPYGPTRFVGSAIIALGALLLAF